MLAEQVVLPAPHSCLKNSACHSNLIQKAKRSNASSVAFDALNQSTVAQTPLTKLMHPTPPGLPSLGVQRTFVLLLEFEDYPHIETDTADVMYQKIFGDGVAEDYPHESLTNFYQRSSHGKLQIEGDVLGWYKVNANRDDTNQAEEVLKALTYYDQQGHDFSQYDNDGNGIIDSFIVIWTGPYVGRTAWNAHFGSVVGLENLDFMLDGKRFRSIASLQESNNYPFIPFSPGVLIHEIGHAFGLSDLYDVNVSVGAPGGLGGLGIMDAMLVGDHNAYNKMMLGWITPQIATGSIQQVSLRPASSSGDAFIIMPGEVDENYLDEFFLVEYRDNNGNDSSLGSNTGLAIWHVNGVQQENGGWKYNNRDTEHKLIKLIQADGNGDIELLRPFDSGDFFQSGDVFSPDTKPASKDISGKHTGVVISEIKLQNGVMTFQAEIISEALLPKLDINEIISNPVFKAGKSVTLSMPSDIAKVEYYLKGELLSQDNSAPFTFTWQDSFAEYGSHELQVKAYNSEGYSTSEYTSIISLPNSPTALLITLSKDNADSPSSIINMLKAQGITPIVSDFIPTLSTNDFDLVMINYGSYRDSDEDGDGVANLNARAATAREQQIMVDYLNEGGKLILEGENVLSSANSESFSEAMGVSLLSDSRKTIFIDQIQGNQDTDFADISGQYYRYSEMDNLQLSNTSGVTLPLVSMIGDEYIGSTHVEVIGTCAAAHERAGYKVVIASCLLSKLPSELRAPLLKYYLSFLGVETTPIELSFFGFTTDAITVSEAVSSVTVTVKRESGDDSSAVISYWTENGTAYSGVDYADNTGEIVFESDELEKQITLTIFNNDVVDNSREFYLKLSGSNVSVHNSMLVVIENDDSSQAEENPPNPVPIYIPENKKSGGAFSLIHCLLLLLLCSVRVVLRRQA